MYGSNPQLVLRLETAPEADGIVHGPPNMTRTNQPWAMQLSGWPMRAHVWNKQQEIQYNTHIYDVT